MYFEHSASQASNSGSPCPSQTFFFFLEENLFTSEDCLVRLHNDQILVKTKFIMSRLKENGILKKIIKIKYNFDTK